MKRSNVTLVVSIALLASGLPHMGGANEGKVIVEETGKAGEQITITITYTGKTGPDIIKFTPAAADVAKGETKAAAIAKAIREQAANSTSPPPAADSKTATVTSKPGATISHIGITAGKSNEKDRVNPKSLASASLPNLQFDLALSGASTGSFAGTVDIGGPGGGIFTLNTEGLSPAAILADLESSIDPFFPAFVSGNSLIITHVTEDNSFLAFFGDEGFQVTYGMSAVPEPSSLIFVLFGGSVLLAGAGVVASRRLAIALAVWVSSGTTAHSHRGS